MRDKIPVTPQDLVKIFAGGTIDLKRMLYSNQWVGIFFGWNGRIHQADRERERRRDLLSSNQMPQGNIPPYYQIEDSLDRFVQ
jgi:hypothetical protein